MKAHTGPHSWRKTVSKKLLLTVGEAAEALALGTTKVYELIASGEIQSVQIGRARRVPYRALQDFLEALEDDDADGAD